MSRPKNKDEYRAELADTFAHVLEEKGLEWQKEWRGSGGSAPQNGITKACYRGCNAFWLSLISMMKGYDDPRWVTMVQIMDQDGKYHPKQNWHLKKGSKATYVEYWYPYDLKDKKALTWEQYKQQLRDGRSETEFKLSTHYTAVFNACDIEGMPELPAVQESDITPDELIGKLSAGMGVEILTDGGDQAYKSALDILFERLEMRNPEHIALKYYRNYHSGSGKTLKSIQITLISRLEKFNLDSLASITQNDELELWSLGEQKTAIFAVIPDNDSSFNFLVGMLYTQLFQQLYHQADFIHGGRLPVPVHFLMDEFANVALPDEFDKLLSTMRSREISVSIIIQNLAQLKALFEKQWESIVGNCDEFLYLGGNEQSTHEYVSKLLGKETIDTNTYGRSKGRNGSYSTNWQLAGRELMTPDEVRMLDNRYALLFIRGERPLEDFKYDILKHPNIALTTDGGAEPYRHGEDLISIAALSIDERLLKKAGIRHSWTTSRAP